MSDDDQLESLYDQAAEIAEKHLIAALGEGDGDGRRAFVAVMMIEAAVNAAVDETGAENVLRLLKELALQIQDDLDADEE